MDKSQDVCMVCNGGPGNDSICSCPPDYRFPGPVSGIEYKSAIVRLKESMTRVKDLVTLYKHHPTTTLDMMDNLTAVTIGDLEILLNGLEDRDISLSEMPELIPLKEIKRDTKLAVEIEKTRVEIETKREAWTKGYDKGYTAGRDGELKRIETLINNYVRGIPND